MQLSLEQHYNLVLLLLTISKIIAINALSGPNNVVLKKIIETKTSNKNIAKTKFLNFSENITSNIFDFPLQPSELFKRDTESILGNRNQMPSSVYPLTQLKAVEVFKQFMNSDVDLIDSEIKDHTETRDIDLYSDQVTPNSNTGNSDDSSGFSRNSKIALDNTPKYRSIEYEDRSLGSILDAFGTGKYGTNEATTLPVFLTEPESTFVVKNRPAILKCKAAHALQVYFKCSGSSQPPPSTYDKHVDPHSGVHLEEVTATIHRDLVDEYFGKGSFKCECQAWSSRGVVKSQPATINVAYIRKQFLASPTSLRAELGSKAELHCEPPSGIPPPKITWYKNDAPIADLDQNGIMHASKGVLSFTKVSLQEMANYTCSAENIAGKRVSDSAVLIVYVNGGWSSWSPWYDCKCSDKERKGKKRMRTCNNPIPINGGLQCIGPQVQKSLDCVSCPDDTQIVHTEGLDHFTIGKWSAWSEWSVCSTDCIQFRRRKCIVAAIQGTPFDASSSNLDGEPCSGKDFQTAECRGEHCHIGKDDFDWTLYVGLVFISAICFSFGASLIYCARRSIGTNTHYDIPRTVMDSDYIQAVDKKPMRIHVDASNTNYDYANMEQICAADDHVNYAMSEHHYDVPNLANYTNPIDELCMDYFNDTVDTSTCTSNSTYDINTKFPPLSLGKSSMSRLSSIRETFHSSGGCARLYNGEIMLYVPYLALGKNTKKSLTLMVLSDDTAHISIPCGEPLLVCSTIVQCLPADCSFLKPVILKIPHCLSNREHWNVSIYHSENHQDDLNVAWRKITTVGMETLNTPIFVHLDRAHAYLMIECLGRYAIAAEPIPDVPITDISINMKLFAFSQLTPINCIIRIYVVRDFPNSKDICSRIETQLGGTYVGESTGFNFYLNHSNLNIKVRPKRECGELLVTHSIDEQEQIIPYNHIISNNSILHCEFSIKRNEQYLMDTDFYVDFMQTNNEHKIENHDFSITTNYTSATEITFERPSTVSMDKQGNYVSDVVIDTVQISPITKRKICAALDPPRTDENDWRLLASKLNSDRYIAYFATKPSPTEQILNLLECRASNTSSTILELLTILKEMNRQDVVDIIEESAGHHWI